MERARSLPVGIVVRRTPGATRWAKWAWRAVAALPGAGPADWKELRRDGEAVEYHAGTAPLELHRAECEAYAESLDAAAPSIWAIFHPTDHPERPWRLHGVTVSVQDAQDAQDSGSELVERIPLSPQLAGWIAEFVEAHWTPERFRKRRRDAVTVDAVETGKGDARVRQAADVYRAPAALKPNGTAGR
jgi:hypothetical protein